MKSGVRSGVAGGAAREGGRGREEEKKRKEEKRKEERRRAYMNIFLDLPGNVSFLPGRAG